MRLSIWSRAALALVLLTAFSVLVPPPVPAADGQVTIGVHVTVAPRWLDPAETESAISPVPRALRDPRRDGEADAGRSHRRRAWPSRGRCPRTASPTTSCCARRKFHNGDPVTAEDVKFSFERYRGGAAKLLKDKVKEVRAVDARRVRFVLKAPWPDFMTFYGTTATGAGWVVPKKYVEKVGEDGFKKAPIGAGPYKFVSSRPGIELVVEAFDGYWRKAPSVKRVVLQQRSRRDHPRGRAQARRRGRRLQLQRPGRRGHPPHAGAEAHHPAHQHGLLPRLRRSVGAQVAVGRPARAPGRQPGRRPQGHQRGRLPGLRRAHRQRRATPHGVRAAAGPAPPSIRPRPRSCWPRPAIPTDSTAAISRRTRPTSPWARPSSPI